MALDLLYLYFQRSQGPFPQNLNFHFLNVFCSKILHGKSGRRAALEAGGPGGRGWCSFGIVEFSLIFSKRFDFVYKKL